MKSFYTKVSILFLSLFFIVPTSSISATTSGEQLNWVPGPTTVTMGDNLTELDVPEGFYYLNAEDTVKYNKHIGNVETGNELGMIIPKNENKYWFIVFEYENVGHIKDNDSDEIDANALLKSFKEGTEEQNKIREENGFAPMKVNGWAESPAYDKQSHNLVWALELESNGEKLINYNTRILGREGYVSATLVSDETELKEAKPVLYSVIKNDFRFTEENRYEDFNESTDKLASFGLTALIAGGAGATAAKVGLFAKLLILLKKFYYIVIVAGVGLFSFFKKKFTRKGKSDDAGVAEETIEDELPEEEVK